MFIYRDEVYNPQTERPHTADIIVAKHRSGPLGEVTLYFKQDQLRFANLDVAFMAGEEEIAFPVEDDDAQEEQGILQFPPNEEEE